MATRRAGRPKSEIYCYVESDKPFTRKLYTAYTDPRRAIHCRVTTSSAVKACAQLQQMVVNAGLKPVWLDDEGNRLPYCPHFQRQLAALYLPYSSR